MPPEMPSLCVRRVSHSRLYVNMSQVTLTVMQRQTAVTAYLKSKQLPLFVFARQFKYVCNTQHVIEY